MLIQSRQKPLAPAQSDGISAGRTTDTTPKTRDGAEFFSVGVAEISAKPQALSLYSDPQVSVMVDRQQLEALLANRFPDATSTQIAAAANAIMAMIRASEDGRDQNRSGFERLRRAASRLP